jgi:hypothetical protein
LAGNALGVHAHEVIGAVQKYALLIIALAILAAGIFIFIQSRRAQRNPS